MKSFWLVTKEYLTKKGFDYQCKAEDDTVSRHETYLDALETLRSESTSILSWQELNAQYDTDLTVLSICEALVEDDGEVFDYLQEDVYVVL